MNTHICSELLQAVLKDPLVDITERQTDALIMLVEDLTRGDPLAIAALEVVDTMLHAPDRWMGAAHRCSCGYSSDDASKFSEHLMATDSMQPQHFEVSDDWTFRRVEQWQATAAEHA